MPTITLPDGSRREFDQPVTIHDIAADIGPGLAKAALAGGSTVRWWIQALIEAMRTCHYYRA